MEIKKYQEGLRHDGQVKQVYTLSINIPIKDKKSFDDWQVSCKQEYGDGRWQKIIQDHYKVKEVHNEIAILKNNIACMDEKIDLLLLLLEES